MGPLHAVCDSGRSQFIGQMVVMTAGGGIGCMERKKEKSGVVCIRLDPAHILGLDPAHTLTSDPAHTLGPDPAHTMTSDPAHTPTSDPAHTLGPDPAYSLTSDPAHTLSPDPAHILGLTLGICSALIPLTCSRASP